MSATKSRPFSLWEFFSSVRLAIALLVLIAGGSILGTLIRQKADAEEYRALYSEGFYRIISFTGLDDVYHAHWFYALILLFGLNLVFCSIKRFKRERNRTIPEEIPGGEELEKYELSFSVPHMATGMATKLIRSAGYRTIIEKEDGAILARGKFSRYGVYIIHASIIVILIGSFIGLAGSQRGFLTLQKGETKDSMVIRGKKPMEIPLGFALKCEDFAIRFYPGGQPKEYVTALEVIEEGKAVKKQEIRVNEPLHYRGFRVYQATYGSFPRFYFAIGRKKVVLQENEAYREGDLALAVVRYAEDIHGLGPGVLVAYFAKEGTLARWFLKDVEKMKEEKILGVPIRLEDIQLEYYTGLEIAKDPGTFVVLSGFVLIIIGLYVNFFILYRRIYVRKSEHSVVIAGVCVKDRKGFEGEFNRLKRKLYGDKS